MALGWPSVLRVHVCPGGHRKRLVEDIGLGRRVYRLAANLADSIPYNNQGINLVAHAYGGATVFQMGQYQMPTEYSV